MSVKVTVQPTLINGSGGSTTRLRIEVDCTEIAKFLNQYDVLLLTTLVIATPKIEEGGMQQETYEYSEIYKDIKNCKITFEVQVYGSINDEKWIKSTAQGILVKKR